MNQKTVGIRIEGTAQGYVAAAGQAEAATQRLSEQQQMQQLVQQRATLTTAQYQQAMRQLPMQITDVVTSLASGMPVWLVAVQQGGQIRDSFDGVGNAFRAVLGSINPVVGGLAAVAATGLTVAVAFEQGRREVEAYQKAIIMTGNAAGVTAGQLDEMARRADGARFGTTQGQSADVLAQLASAGGVSRSQIDQAMQVAIGLQRELGIEIEKTVQAYAAMGRDPLQGAIKLNEQANFLTLELYEQIKALTEQKRFAEAAALAQQGYSDKTLERLKAVEGELGYIDRMWRGITGTAREAWDAMRGVGRQTTLQEELRSVQQQLANNRMRGFGDVALPGLGPSPNEALRERESVLQSELRLQQMAADRQAQEAAAVRDRIAEDKDKPGTGSARRRPDAWEYGPPSSLQWRPAQPRFQEGAFERDEISMEERGAAWQRHRDQMVQTAMSTAQQMREANDLEDAYAIRSAEARGRAIIAIEEAQARSRIDLNVLTGDQRKQVEEEFARWRVARERQLTEDLKPEWQRMVESWADATALMQRTFDQSVAGSLRIGEDAFVSFVTTGKASIKDLTDFLIEQSVRMAYRNVAVQALAFLFGGSDYAGTAPGGGYTGFEFGGRRAAGGDVRRGRSYWVGENGPELLSMGDEGGWITSNERLRAAMGGGGGAAGGVVAVTLNNQSGTALQVGGTSLGEDGTLEVLLLAVDEFMADRVSSGIGKFPSALGTTYGLRRSFGSV